MQTQLRNWLIQSGFPEEIELSPLRGGLGSTALWTFSPSPNAAQLVVRAFPEDSDAVAEREYLAMRAAAEHGVPVPTVIMKGEADGWPVLVTTFATGIAVTQQLARQAERAHAIGLAMGDTMGRLHEVTAPEGLVRSEEAWIDRAGPAVADLRPLFIRMTADTNRLLHLDFHPNNVLMDDERVSAIIDWENTLAGPPHIDLARSRAILRAVKMGGKIPEELHHVFDEFERGLVEGHTGVVGQDPHPELSLAWALAMTVDDLTGHLGKPGSWVTEDVIGHLRDERDQAIAAVVGD